MLFNSIEFLIFFPTVVLLYYLLPGKFRWAFLLFASCLFYMFFIPHYIFILFVTIIIDFYAGIWIEKSQGKRRKTYLILSIVTTCLVLFIFKYWDFFHLNMLSLSQILGYHYPSKWFKFILPIGLSFHTFQSLAYVIEVYRGRQTAEKHFGIYSLYVMFFPQLVTGPIERPANLLTQLREYKSFEINNIINGLRLILFGLFFKMVIADNLGTTVDLVFQDPSSYSSLSKWIGAFFYSIQIYGDFCGYSAIAIGSALVMGYRLIDNFNTPYLSSTIAEFWSRWHISLSNWFRDYVYFPLGGNKVSYLKWLRNIIIVFGVSGLWHGASWNFIFWGLLHALVYIIQNAIEKRFSIPKFQFFKYSKIAFNFFLVSLIWIPFRATNFKILKEYFLGLFHSLPNQQPLEIPSPIWLLTIIPFILDLWLKDSRFDLGISKINIYVRWILYFIMIFSIISFSSVENYQFIYFQF